MAIEERTPEEVAEAWEVSVALLRAYDSEDHDGADLLATDVDAGVVAPLMLSLATTLGRLYYGDRWPQMLAAWVPGQPLGAGVIPLADAEPSPEQLADVSEVAVTTLRAMESGDTAGVVALAAQVPADALAVFYGGMVAKFARLAVGEQRWLDALTAWRPGDRLGEGWEL